MILQPTILDYLLRDELKDVIPTSKKVLAKGSALTYIENDERIMVVAAAGNFDEIIEWLESTGKTILFLAARAGWSRKLAARPHWFTSTCSYGRYDPEERS